MEMHVWYSCSPLAFVGLFFTIRLQPTKSAGKESNFLSISYVIHSPLPIQKVTACSRHPTKGFHMVGCVQCGRVISIPRLLKATAFSFVHVIKALSLLRCGPSALSSTLRALIHNSHSVLLLFHSLN